MNRLIDISWPALGVTIVGALHDDNPELSEEFWRHLPFTSLAVHPVAGGEIMYCWAPIVSGAPTRKRGRVMDAPVGQLRYSGGGGNKFGMQYGEGFEPSMTPGIGDVLPEHLPTLQRVGPAIWENLFWKKQPIFMEVRPHDPAAAVHGPTGYESLSGPLLQVYREALRLQTEEPEDIRAIRHGEIGEAGSYGQYFSPWHMAHSRLHDLIVANLYGLYRFGLTVPLDEFQRSFAALAQGTEYLGFLGLKQLHQFGQVMHREVMGAQNSEDAMLALKTFLLYGYRLCSWSFLHFPWYLGIHFGRSVRGQDLPGRVMKPPSPIMGLPSG